MRRRRRRKSFHSDLSENMYRGKIFNQKVVLVLLFKTYRKEKVKKRI